MVDDNIVQEIKKECDNYKHTVWALLAFANHSMWDSENKKIYTDSKYSLGRRMTTTEEKIVTPDLIVQRSALYGLVCEAKRDLPMPREHWDKLLNQLTKYDHIKEGWFTSTQIDNYDLVFLTDISRSVDFGDFLEGSGIKYNHKLAIVGFEPTTETTDTFITLKREKGNLSDAVLDSSLRLVTKVSLKNIEKSIGKVKFYDSAPPVVYTTWIFWENVCNAKRNSETWNKSKKAHILRLNTDEVARELQEYYGKISTGEREQEIPKKKWIRNVIDFLIAAGYAEKTDEYETFVIIWKKIKGDILERFSELWIKLEQKMKKKMEIEKAEQLGLF